MPRTEQLVSGVYYIGLARWAAQVLSWASTLLVIRMLRPEDYGVMGMAAAFVGVASVLSEFGMGTAVVALPSLTERQKSQLCGAALLVSVLVALLLTAAAPLIANFFREPALRGVIPALSVGFVLEGFRSVPVALLSRKLAYRTTASLHFARSLTASIGVLTLAFLDFGYWALVFGNLAGSALSAAWVLARHRQPLAWPRYRDLRVPLTYSRHILASRAAWSAYINSDFLIAGRMFGADVLGYYTVAWNLASLPGEKLGNVLTAATGPFFSSIQHDLQALRRYFLHVTEALALVLLPLLCGILLVADLAIPLIIGDRMSPAVPALRILIAFAALNGVVNPIAQILHVTANTRAGMHGSLLSLLVLPPAFFLGARLGGVAGVAWAWVVTYPALVALPLGTALRALNLGLAEYIGAWRRALEGLAVMIVVVLLGRLVIPVDFDDWIRILALVAGGGTAYLATLALRHPAVLRDALDLLRRRTPLPEPAVETSPVVSVIIPAYNVSDHIAEALESVLSQDYPYREVIVVNDGSEDAPALERALAPYRDRIRYLSQPNLGASAARNAGLAVAKGELVAFLDGDDYWNPGYLRSQVNFLNSQDLDMVYANAELVGEVSEPGRTFMEGAPSRGAVTPLALIDSWCSVITSGTVVRRDILNRLGGFDRSLRRAQDFDMWFRVAKSGGRIGYQRDVLLCYRVREGSLSGDAFTRVGRELTVLRHIQSTNALTKREDRHLRRVLRRRSADLEIVHGKAALAAGDLPTARNRVATAVKTHFRLKRLAVLLALWVTPGLVARLSRAR